MVCPANLWAGTEMVNPDRTQRQTGHSLLQFGGDSMNALANQWKIEAIPAPPAAKEVQLPEIVDAEQFLNESLETPAELVSGLIHRNPLTIFSGGSKT